MNCHGNQDNNSRTNQHDTVRKGHKGHLSHMLMMALCCGAPILILLLVPLLTQTGGSSGLSKLLLVIAPFICLIMMAVMIPMMLKGSKEKAPKPHGPSQAQLDEKTPDTTN